MREYVTIQADTWDQIALKAYGSDLQTRDLMAENGTMNPELLTIWRFEWGRRLMIPEITESSAAIKTLPEYRRSDD